MVGAEIKSREVHDKRFLGLLFIFFFFTFAYFFQSGQDNENSRLDQARAMVEHAELNINRYAGNTADVVQFEGKIYPNKAPGGTFIILPQYFIFSNVLSWLPFSVQYIEHFVCYLVTLTSVGLLAALLNVALFLVLQRVIGRTPEALFLTLAYGLGSIAFPFSTLLFSHQITAALLFMSFAILFFMEEDRKQGELQLSRRTQLLAVTSGFFLGYAFTCEYPAALAVAPIGLYGLSVFRLQRKLIYRFIQGGLWGLLFIALYNYLAFGKLFFITYSLYTTGDKAMFPEHRKGFMGVSIPRLDVLGDITIRSQRGLFFCNPWMALIVPALGSPFYFEKYRKELILALFIVVAFFAFNAGFAPGIVYSGGGASVGPRHILPMLPFATLLIAPLLRISIFRQVAYVLMSVSIPIMLMATATEPRVAYEYINPVRDLFWFNFRDGRFALHRHGTFNQRLLTEDSVSFNLGKLFGLPGPWQLAPLLLFWLAGFIVLLLILKRRGLLPKIRLPILWVLLIVSILILLPVVRAEVKRYRETGNHGLRGTYIQGVPWENCPQDLVEQVIPPEKIIRREKNLWIVFNWDEYGPPIPGSFSIEWKGALSVPSSGRYVFGTNSDDGSCVYLDGKLVVDNWGVHGARIKDGRVSLGAGFHDLVVRYSNEQFGGMMELLWAREGQHLMPIPKEALFEAPEPALPPAAQVATPSSP